MFRLNQNKTKKSTKTKNFPGIKCFYSVKNIFHIFDQLGLNFNAINLKFSEIVENYVAYNFLKFQIYSIKIKGLSIQNVEEFFSQKFFRILDG